MPAIKNVIQPAAFQLKGSLFTLTVLHLLQTDIAIFMYELAALVKATPNFFRNAPVVIDLEKVMDRYDNIDFVGIKAELINHGLIPVGIRHGNEQQIKAAIAAGLGIMPPVVGKQEKAAKATPPSSQRANNAKIISLPVRSGQQVYAQHSDLIVLASVSPGAELMADGHIHVYGNLRGRALAGVSGDVNARIFCYRLEAELISIAGFYKLRDDIKVPGDNQSIQIYLEQEKLQIVAI